MNYLREKVDIKGKGVEFITLQTNEQNSFTRTNLLELQDIFESIKKDNSIHSVVITSNNEKFFSNGVDAENIIKTEASKLDEEMVQIVHFFNYLLSFYKPMIAEITGYAMGGGAVLALACDYRYMLDGKGRLSFTEVFFGLPLAGTFIEKLKFVMPPKNINEYIYGTIFKAKEAYENGFLHGIARDKSELRKMVNQKLEQITKIPLTAFEGTKRSLHKPAVESIEKHMKDLGDSFANPIVKKNLLEAMSSLKEKRRPKFID
ncbi:MAG: enoyl-CoA hydratase/isomerase family protein [Leptospiraceae bacterium]|nr:enoyl-CoA hydratase/isomerase family protein [Leptospiraceae bacterium]